MTEQVLVENSASLAEEQKKQKEMEEYEKETKETMAKFVVGGKDTYGNTIKWVFYKNNKCAIYDVEAISSANWLMVYISPELKGSTIKEEDDLHLRYYKIIDKLNEFKSIFYKTNADFSYKSRAADAVSLIFGCKQGSGVEKTRESLENLTKEALDEYTTTQKGRLWYFAGAIVYTLIATLIALGCYLIRTSNFAVTNQALLLFIYASAFSAFGGLFSISIHLKEILIEKEIIEKEAESTSVKINKPNTIKINKYMIYGGQRLLFSTLAGLGIVVLLKSGVVFPDLMSGKNNLYALMAMCYLAGFSETLVPHALKNLEEKTEKKS